MKKWCWAILLKPQHPKTGDWLYFFDKCLPFGASISCKLFQDFSDAVIQLVQYRTQKRPINYLDDFFFTALLKLWCDWQIEQFLKICKKINFPVSLEKTFWGDTTMIFLGLLLDSERQIVCIPKEKIDRAKHLIKFVMNHKKIKVVDLQKLTGFLNFLCHATVPGRAFTRRLYAFVSSKMLPHHHIRVNMEMKEDLAVWSSFLASPECYSRLFIDFKGINAEDIDKFSNASLNLVTGGLGAYCRNEWMALKWDSQFISDKHISIDYLELYAVTAAVMMLDSSI